MICGGASSRSLANTEASRSINREKMMMKKINNASELMLDSFFKGQAVEGERDREREFQLSNAQFLCSKST